jgi:hypothetical protein
MKISYDKRAILVNGKRELILSGAIHYPRSTPDMWPDLMKKTRDAGLNTVETYVFWNLHERKQGVFDFSGRLNLLRFIEEADKAGLKFILRVGPYICAEISYGGFPVWLRDIPGIQFRTWNEPFMREMERWVRHVCELVRPCLASNGGPIILAQIENEYMHMRKYSGEAGDRYIRWARDLTKDLNVDIPWFMCYGAPEGILETINDFNPHVFIDGTFADLLETHPNQPAICTELWTGWIDVYGVPQHKRSAESVAYSAARFLAAGGTGINYYMWHGGTNFNREQMFLQTTSYDYDAPLDEAGMPTVKYNHLKSLHEVIVGHRDFLLKNSPAVPVKLADRVVVYTYEINSSCLVFLCNDDLENDANIIFEGKEYSLPAISVKILKDKSVLFDSSALSFNKCNTGVLPVDFKYDSVSDQVLETAFTSIMNWREPIPWNKDDPRCVISEKPIEQLLLTKDESDYCWYSTQIKITEDQQGKQALSLNGVADLAYVYIDGKLVAQSHAPKLNRGHINGDGFNQEFQFELLAGAHILSILCCSAGLIKGNGLIGGDNMVEERKGLWGNVFLNGSQLPGPWRIFPGLLGEKNNLFRHDDIYNEWTSAIDKTRVPCWWKIEFACQNRNSPLFLDLTGMTRGIAWLNSECVGRYWIIPSSHYGDFKPGDPTIQVEKIGAQTQCQYHLPVEWLQENNTLIIFDENGGSPEKTRLLRRKNII